MQPNTTTAGLDAGGVSLHLWPDTASIPADDVEGGADWLGASERARLAGLRGQRRREFILGRVLLRSALSAAAGCRSPRDWQLIERHELPPLLKTEDGSRNFSVSHSGGYIAVAVGCRAGMGVDIERHRPRRFLALAEHWFHPNEFECVRALAGDAQAQAFFRIWTLKEAALKSRCAGIFSGYLRQLDFSASQAVSPGAGQGPVCRLAAAPYRDTSLAVTVDSAATLRVFEWSSEALGNQHYSPRTLVLATQEYAVRWPESESARAK